MIAVGKEGETVDKDVGRGIRGVGVAAAHANSQGVVMSSGSLTAAQPSYTAGVVVWSSCSLVQVIHGKCPGCAAHWNLLTDESQRLN